MNSVIDQSGENIPLELRADQVSAVTHTASRGPAQPIRPITWANPEIQNPDRRDRMAESVAKVFAPTKTFCVRFDEIARTIDLVERIGESATDAYGPLRSFHAQLSELSRSFEPLRAFQTELKKLGETFEPMRLMHDQVAQLPDAIQTELAQLVTTLDSAKRFADHLVALADSLQPACELQTKFGELQSAFARTTARRSSS